jgi:hypothetical protein
LLSRGSALLDMQRVEPEVRKRLEADLDLHRRMTSWVDGL